MVPPPTPPPPLLRGQVGSEGGAFPVLQLSGGDFSEGRALKWEVSEGPRNLPSWDPLSSSDPNYLQMAWRQGWASAQMGTLRLRADSLEFLATGRPCHDGLWLSSRR